MSDIGHPASDSFALNGTGAGTEADSILAKTVRGAGWVIGWRMATRLLGLLSTLILVRLLAPGDFGLVALATSFSQAIDQLSWVGVDEALLRQKDPTRDVYDTAFTMNMLRGLATAAVVVAAAFPVSVFFKEPRLLQVLLCLAMVSMIAAFENVGTVDFRRNFAFHKEFQLMIAPRLVGIMVASSTALLLRSYWALVFGIASTQSLRILMGYVMHPYRPHLTLAAWRRLAGFSAWSWAMSIVGMMRDRVDSFVIGRVLNLAAVGLYSVAAEIALLPTTELTFPLGRACFSGFIAARDSGVSTANTYFRVVGTMALFVFPTAAGISLVADPVVRLAFGSRWIAGIALVQIIGFGGVVMLFGIISYVLFQAHALMGTIFRIQVATALLRLGLMIGLVVKLGLIGAGIAVVIAMVAEHGAYTIAAFRRFRLPMADLLTHIWRGLFATAAMVAVLVAAGLGWSDTATAPAAKLLLAVPIGAATYTAALVGAWFTVGRPPGAESDVVALVRGLIRGRRTRIPGLAA